MPSLMVEPQAVSEELKQTDRQDKRFHVLFEPKKRNVNTANKIEFV